MNNLTRVLLTTASVTALVISAQTTARAATVTYGLLNGGGAVSYGEGGSKSDGTGAGGGFQLSAQPDDTVSLEGVTIDKTATAAAAGAGTTNAFEVDNTTGSLTVKLAPGQSGATLTEESTDHAAALFIENLGNGLTTLDTTGTTSPSTFTGTQGIVVSGVGDVSITTATGDTLSSNNPGNGFSTFDDTGGDIGFGGSPGYSAGIYASSPGNITIPPGNITITNNANITSTGGGFDVGIATFGNVTTVNNNGNVYGKWAGVLGEAGSGALTVNNNGTINSGGYGIEQLGNGTLTVHNYGTGVIEATTTVGKGEGIGIVSYSGTPLNVTNDAGGFIVGQYYGISGNNAADNITNAGTIAAGTYSAGTVMLGGSAAISLANGGTVVNGAANGSASALIEGGEGGIRTFGTANITNYANATIKGITLQGIYAANNLTLVNLGTISSGEGITSGSDAVGAYAGATATIHNAGNITTNGYSAIHLTGSNNVITNDSSGIITGGSAPNFGYGVQFSDGANGTLNNYGDITGGTDGVGVISGANATINLYAGSTTGNVTLVGDGGGSVVALYTGLGTTNSGLIDTVANNATQQANGTLAAAVYGNITGNTGDVLELRGSGDGTGAYGAAGVIDLSSAPASGRVISGFSSVLKEDSGTWQFYNAGGDANVPITLQAGTIDAMTTNAFGGATINVTGASTIEFSATGSYGNAVNLDIASPSATNALTFKADSGITANVTAIPASVIGNQSIVIGGGGTGTVVLGGTETYTGTTTITSGTLSLGTAGDISSSTEVNIVGGTLDVSSETATPTINNLSGSVGTVEFGAQGLTVNSNINTDFDGVISQTAAGGLFTKTGNGTLELGGANTYTVGTVIANGTLQLTSPNAIADSASVNLTSANSILNAAGTGISAATIHNLSGVSGSQVQFGTKGLTVTNSATTTFAGTITGTGGTFTVNGGGNLTLTGNSNYTAPTVVSNDTTLSLGVSGALASGANITVNDTSRLYMNDVSQTFGTVALGGGTPGGTLALYPGAHATINSLTMAGGTVSAQGEGTLLTVEQLSGDANSTINLEGVEMRLGANGTASTYSGTFNIYDVSFDHGFLDAGNLTFNGTLTASNGGAVDATNFNLTGGTVNVRGSNSAGGKLTAGTFNQSGGVVAVGEGTHGGVLNATTYNLSNGSLSIYGGENGNAALTAATFNQTGGSVTITNGEYGGVLNATTYNMTAGSLTVNGNNATGSVALTATTFNQNGGNITINGGETGGTLNATTFNQSAGNITIGTSGIGTAQLTAGTFDQTGGDVTLNRNGQLIVGTLTGANGTIVLGEGELVVGSSNANSTYGGNISNQAVGMSAGSFVKQGNGTLTLSGNNNYSGSIDIEAGVLKAGSATAFGVGVVQLSAGAALDLAGYSSTFYGLLGAGGTVTDSSTTPDTLELDGGNSVFGGMIEDGSGRTSVTIDSGSGLALYGVNTYSGTTTVASRAKLKLGNGTDNGSIANSAVADAGTVDLSYNPGGTSSFASLSGNGTVNMGSGLLTLTNAHGTFSGVLQDGGENGGTGASLEVAGGREVLSGANTFTGNTTIDSGATLQLGAGGTTGSLAGPVIDNGTLAYDLSTPTTISSVMSGTGGLEIDLSTVTITVAQPGFTGASLIAPNATLALSGEGTLDVPLTDNGTFDISAAAFARTIQSLTGNGTIALGENGLTLSAADGAFSGSIGGSGGLTLTGGEQTLSGVNTYTGATTISANTTLALSGTGSVADSSSVLDAGTFDISATTNGATVNALTGSGNVVLGNQTLTIADATGTFSGVASGTGGGLDIAGGTETLSGASTYSGTTTIGANAILALSGTGSISDSSVTDNGTFDISGTANGAQIGSLNGNGSIFLGSKTLTFVGADGAFTGDITDGGDDGHVVIDSGTQTLTGDNTYGGGTLVEAGSTLIVNSPEALGTGTITFGPNSTIEFTSNGTFTQNVVFEADAPVYDVGSSTITWSGAMSGAGDLAVTGSGGTLLLTNTGNSYTGGTEVYGGATLNIGADSELGGVAPLQLGGATTSGTLQLADSFNLASGRAVTLDAGGGTIDTQAFNMTIAHAITGAGGLTKEGSGTLTLTGANTYTGGTAIAKGTVQIGAGGTSGSVAGNIADDGAVVFDRSNAMTYAGVISGNGTLTQSGSDVLTLTGANTLTGATSVNDGTLLVDGSLSSSAVTVNNGGTLGGTGTVGGTTVASGGTLAPGAAGAGTLSVHGNLTLSSGAATDIDITPTAADKVAVSGTATLGGTLAISAGAGTYSATDYTLVTASGVSGTFSTVTGGVTGFDSTIEYSPTAVTLDLTASGSGTPPPPPVVTYDFSAYGVTPNEIAAGTALQAADPSGLLYMATGTAVTSNPAAAPGKLNQLTGELHASARSALIEDGRVIRESVLDHLALDPDGMTVWGTGFAGNGRIDATSNTGALHHTNSGFIAGIDTPISDWSPDLRVGLAGAYNADHASVAGLGSNLHSSTGHVVAYAGWTGGPWAAKAGIDLGWGDAHITRDVAFLGETEHSSQSTRTTQEFGDVGYNIALDTVALQPYFDLAHVDARTGGFTETGGLAALSGSGAQDNVTYSTLGGRVSLNPWTMGGWSVTPRADIGWQHAFSRVNPDDAVAFNDNGQGFVVDGAPLDKDAAAIQGGVDIAITPQAVISLTYDGTFSSNVKDNTFRGGFIWKF